MKSYLALLLVGAGASGCHQGTKPVVTRTEIPAPPQRSDTVVPGDPEQSGYEGVRAAAYQIEVAFTKVESALRAAKTLAPIAGGDAKEALLEVAEKLDGAGASLTDANESVPPFAEYHAHFAEQDEARLFRIDTLIDGLKELRDAQSVLDDLGDNVPAEHKTALESISEANGEAVDATETAINQLGGKVPADEAETGSQASL